ncbi:hypothetical protein BC827DRAFT_746480 [Russula dissimulans]|nr:hypothetical protein BC827DRAFT_746480 [Russula dissimulans]
MEAIDVLAENVRLDYFLSAIRAFWYARIRRRWKELTFMPRTARVSRLCYMSETLAEDLVICHLYLSLSWRKVDDDVLGYELGRLFSTIFPLCPRWPNSSPREAIPNIHTASRKYPSNFNFLNFLEKKKRVSLCFFPPENEFVNELFLRSRFLFSFSKFRLVGTRTSSYESKKVSGRFPDAVRLGLLELQLLSRLLLTDMPRGGCWSVVAH